MEKILGDITARLKEPLGQVENQMAAILTVGDANLDAVMTPLQRAGGKRIRPVLVILSAQCFTDRAEKAVPVAVCAELVHTATLMHDDVVDNASLRRGQPTLHSLWGNKIAILAGDNIFAKAIDLLVTLGDLRLLRAMAGMIARMGEGEILQIFQAYNPDLAEEDYYERIRRKTALFLSTCCEMGAITADAPPEAVASLTEYGLNLGMAFQVVDDLLDFVGEEEKTGKPVGSDLVEGNITLPVLHALRVSPQREKLRQMIKERAFQRGTMKVVQDILVESGSLDYARQVAQDFANKAVQALASIPDTLARQLLVDLANYTVVRAV